MVRYVFGAVLLLVAAGMAVLVVIGARPATVVVQTTNTSGQEKPEDGAFYANGWNVANIGNARIMDAYLRYQSLLAEPISAFDGRCQNFRLGRLCFEPGNPPDWQVQFDNLGLDDLHVEGRTEKVDAAPHPAVRDWVMTQMEAGVDVLRVVGRFLSDPVCDPRTGECRQWTDKQLFLFPKDALTADQVHRAPLGLWLSHPQTRPTEIVVASPHVNLPLTALALLLALTGILTLFGPRPGSGSGSLAAV